jgi:hypothetical protein
LSALGRHGGLPDESGLPREYGSPLKVALRPRHLASAFSVHVRERAPLRLVVIPRLADDDHAPRRRFLDPDEVRAALAAACCTPYDEDWRIPWFADRTRSADELAHGATELIDALTARVPVVEVAAGVHGTGLLDHLADMVTEERT